MNCAPKLPTYHQGDGNPVFLKSTIKQSQNSAFKLIKLDDEKLTKTDDSSTYES
jgi:hypothetical protein